MCAHFGMQLMHTHTHTHTHTRSHSNQANIIFDKGNMCALWHDVCSIFTSRHLCYIQVHFCECEAEQKGTEDQWLVWMTHLHMDCLVLHRNYMQSVAWCYNNFIWMRKPKLHQNIILKAHKCFVSCKSFTSRICVTAKFTSWMRVAEMYRGFERWFQTKKNGLLL